MVISVEEGRQGSRIRRMGKGRRWLEHVSEISPVSLGYRPLGFGEVSIVWRSFMLLMS